jgi:hypothetical protein
VTFYIILVLLCVYFTSLQQVGELKYGLKISFFLIFLFLALRHDYGNDYGSYFRDFLNLQSFQDENFYLRGYEFGWLYLNFLFKYLFGNVGWHLMLASMAAFSIFVLYRFTTKYVPTKYFTFTIALLLLNQNTFLILSSAMRQSIAVSIFLLSFDYLLKRKYFHYIAGIVLGSFFHSSVLIFIVLVSLNLVNWKIYLPYIIFGLFGLFFALNNLEGVFNEVLLLLESQESEYQIYANSGFNEIILGFGFALSVFLYFLAIFVNRTLYQDQERNTISKTVVVALILLIFGLSLPIASRLGIYLFPLVLSAYVMMFQNLNKFVPSGLMSGFLMIIIASFYAFQNYLFWQSELWSPYFTEYKSIFESPLLF